MLQRGNSGDGCDFTSTLYDLRKGDLFVMSWARVRRARRQYHFRVASVWLRCAQ